MDIDDLYKEEQTPVINQEEETIQQEESDNVDFTKEVLSSKGIEDPSRIKFEEDDGSIIERDWNDLTKEEQLNILNTPVNNEPTPQYNVEQDNELSDEEIEFINTLRSNNMTPQQYMQEIINSYEQPPMYKVDELDDDDLYILDLESKVGELSEEDASQALSIAKQNEELFKKQVEGIRKEFKEREDFNQQQEQAAYEEQQRQVYEEYSSKILDAIDNFNSIGNLDLKFENSDKDELASFILSQDENNNNYLYQALQDPETLTKAAWFILNGEEAINNISEYFINQIKLVSENQYKKGLEDGKNGTQTRVIINKNTNNKNRIQPKSIDDLDYEN